MKPVFVRPARPEDQETFVRWTLATSRNAPDPEVLTYRNTSIRCAYDKDGPLVFLPIQRPLHLESLAVRPEASHLQVARALSALLQDAVASAHQEGSGEIYFAATEASVPALAINHDFEELPYRLYRLRVKNTERSGT